MYGRFDSDQNLQIPYLAGGAQLPESRHHLGLLMGHTTFALSWIHNFLEVANISYQYMFPLFCLENIKREKIQKVAALRHGNVRTLCICVPQLSGFYK